MLPRYQPLDQRPELVQSVTVGIMGYGNQGAAHAQNLRDSGVRVLVSTNPNGPSRDRAAADGFEPLTNVEVVQRCDWIMLLVPDGGLPDIFRKEIAPHLSSNKTLLFCHGFAQRFGLIDVPSSIDTMTISPKGAGYAVRESFPTGGLPTLIAISQDATGQAQHKALSYAWGIGSRKTLIGCRPQDEVDCDLFGEQAVLCGGISALLKTGFDVLVGAGYPPEIAYFECVHELKLIVDLVAKRGLSGMHDAISGTATFGDFKVGPQVIGEASRHAMEQALARIQDGSFAKEWVEEFQNGSPTLRSQRESERNLLIETIGQELRDED